MPAENPAKIVDQIVAEQLPRGYVDAGEHRVAASGRPLPLRKLARGALEREQAEIDDHANFFGDPDELRRRQPAHFGMIPAHQRLEARHGAVLEPDDGLVQQHDLVALERVPQLGLQRQTIAPARAHRRLEHFDAVAADALAVIHGELGVFQDLFLARRLSLGKRQADRGGEQDFAVVEGDRSAQGLADGIGESGDAVGLALGEQQQAVLIAAQPRQGILRLEQAAEPPRQRQQDRIADRDPDRIIDLLETIEIDHHHGRPDRRIGLGEG